MSEMSGSSTGHRSLQLPLSSVPFLATDWQLPPLRVIVAKTGHHQVVSLHQPEPMSLSHFKAASMDHAVGDRALCCLAISLPPSLSCLVCAFSTQTAKKGLRESTLFWLGEVADSCPPPFFFFDALPASVWPESNSTAVLFYQEWAKLNI